MSIIEAAVRLFAPYECLGCQAEDDRLLCAACAEKLPRIPSRCYRCAAATAGYAVCRECGSQTPLCQVLVYTRYQKLAKDLIHRMKYERAQAGAAEAATLMARLLADVPDNAVLAHIPTATSRVRQRGYDHALLLARALAHSGNRERAALLARVGQAHQVGSGRMERVRQLHDAFRPMRAGAIQGRHVLLVDDVLTTGATLETAARILKQAGAERVSAIVFAQA